MCGLFCYVEHIIDMINCGNDVQTSSLRQTQPGDPAEKKRQRERERYAVMRNDKKSELLSRKHGAYKERKSLAGINYKFNKIYMILWVISLVHTLMVNPQKHALLLLSVTMSFYQSKLKLGVQRIGHIMLTCLISKGFQRRLFAHYGAMLLAKIP
jgi:hypothetical protein